MKNRSYIKNVLAITLIVIGSAIILYPNLRDFYYDIKQQEIKNNYIKSMSAIRAIDGDTNQDIDSIKENIIEEDESLEDQTVQQSENKKMLELDKKWPVEATLIIEKIDLLMPILKGATKEHLNVSIASINNTGKPWEGNNYAIAGHRSRKYGRHFNRLNELEIDDEISVVDTKNNEFIYRVFSKEIVSENEISVLENRNKSEITLITCDPINVKNPPTRLVVKAIQIN